MNAHIRNGQIVRRFPGTAKITLEDGRVVFSAGAGFVDGNDKVLPVVPETADTSTTSRTVTTNEFIVEALRVLYLTTIRDMTQEEIDAEDTAEFEDAVAEVTDGRYAKVLFKIVNEIQALKGQNPLTPAQFRNWVRNNQL